MFISSFCKKIIIKYNTNNIFYYNQHDNHESIIKMVLFYLTAKSLSKHFNVIVYNKDILVNVLEFINNVYVLIIFNNSELKYSNLISDLSIVNKYLYVSLYLR